MFITVLFTVATRWKQPKCSSVDEWIYKIWSIRTMEYSALKRNEILTLATTWVNLEDMLREISQSPKDRSFMLPVV